MIDDAEPVGVETDDAEASDDPVLKSFEWRIGKNLTRRLDQYLVDRVGYLSRNAVQKLIEVEAVHVNGHKAKSSYKPRENDIVSMSAPPPRAETIEPEDIPLDVVYEDEHFLAINKQSNLIVHPARGVWNGTLVNALIHYGKRWSTVGGEKRPGILHRLDRNTTGVMLVAKSDEAHWRIARQFERRTIQKTYLAVAHGVPDLLADVIDRPIGRDRFVREKQAVPQARERGEGGRHEVRGRRDLPAADGGRGVAGRRASARPPDDAAAREIFAGEADPEDRAGRTSCASTCRTWATRSSATRCTAAGWVRAGEFAFARQALHAYEITFTHPGTLEPMTLSAPLPPDIEQLLGLLRGEDQRPA